MSEPNPAPEGAPAPQDPGTRREPKASTTAKIMRENDLMRLTIDARVLDISAAFVSLRAANGFHVSDQVKIQLQNIVQRIEKEVRGRVRLIEPCNDGTADLSVDLFTRLTPLEVSMLKMGILPPDADAAPKWV